MAQAMDIDDAADVMSDSLRNMNISESPGMIYKNIFYNNISPRELEYLVHKYNTIKSRYVDDLSDEDKNEIAYLNSMNLYIYYPQDEKLKQITFSTVVSKFNDSLHPAEYNNIMTYGLYYNPNQPSRGGKRYRKSKLTRKSKRTRKYRR